MESKKTTKTLLADLRKKADKIDINLIAMLIKRAVLESEIKYIKSSHWTSDSLSFQEQIKQDRQIAQLVKKFNKEFNTQVDVKAIHAIFENIEWIAKEMYANKKFDEFF